MAVPTLNEGSRCWVKAKFYDRRQVLQTPADLRYRIDCETTGQVVLDWTAYTPSSTVEIAVASTLNAIINNANVTERKVMTVEANHATPSQAFNDFQKWDVINQQGQ